MASDSSSVDGSDGWVQVSTGGPVRTLSENAGVYAGGGTATHPILVNVRDGVPTSELAQPLAGPGPVEAVVGWEGEFTLYGGPVGTPAAGLWLRDLAETTFAKDSPRTGTWFSPLVDGEEDTRAVGASETDGEWRLHAWLYVDQWEQLDSGPAPVIGVVPSAQTILSSTTETTVMVAINDASDNGSAPEIVCP
jgi:hypothetical protein